MKYAEITRFTKHGQRLILAVEWDGFAFSVYNADMERLSRVNLRALPNAYTTFIDESSADGIKVYINFTDGSHKTLYFDINGQSAEHVESESGATYNSDYDSASGSPQRKVMSDPDHREDDCLVDLEGNRHGRRFGYLKPRLWKDGHGRYTFVQDKEGADGGNISYRGVVDEEGRVLLPAVYDWIDVLGLDRYWVKQGRRNGMVDSAGQWIYTVNDYMYLLD